MPAGGAVATGNASSHARIAPIVPMLLRLVPRLEAAFPGVPIKLRGDAGFALPLLYEFRVDPQENTLPVVESTLTWERVHD
jgi:hypothetical protein